MILGVKSLRILKIIILSHHNASKLSKATGAMSKQYMGHIKNILPGVDYTQMWDNFSINKNNKWTILKYI